MKEFTYTVTDPNGIDCKKIFAIMGLGIKGGMEVVLSFDGEDEDAAYEKISAFMKENL